MGLYAFDGTWQNAKDQQSGCRTNVWKFTKLYSSNSESFYAQGAGTYLGLGKNPISLSMKGLGAIAGIGTDISVDRAYSRLCQGYIDGDRDIDVVGYSRGAASALAFVWRISREGIHHPKTGEKLNVPTTVRFLGLWDTVFFIMGTRGLPHYERLKSIYVRYRFLQQLYSQIFIEKTGTSDFRLPTIVGNTFHALALHERRWAYTPARFEAAHEVWFAGKHSDVGGGGNSELSDISLYWMIKKAQKCGLPVESVNMPAAHRKVHGLSDTLYWDKVRHAVRQGDYIHASVPDLADGAMKVLSMLEIE